jgi:hypothetical protein
MRVTHLESRSLWHGDGYQMDGADLGILATALLSPPASRALTPPAESGVSRRRLLRDRRTIAASSKRRALRRDPAACKTLPRRPLGAPPPVRKTAQTPARHPSRGKASRSSRCRESVAGHLQLPRRAPPRVRCSCSSRVRTDAVKAPVMRKAPSAGPENHQASCSHRPPHSTWQQAPR